ncbi:MAG TPA: EAL domain-containing protein [Candidatus Limnocylindrales bacterium]|nr:EAL domain-containing protein [Candidatus Limnocylindrales bacterium]
MQTTAHPTAFGANRPRGLNPSWGALKDRLPVRTILLAGIPILGCLMFFSAINLGGLVVLWEPAYTTVAGLLGTAVAASAAHRTNGLERRLRMLVALAAASWTVGQLCWDLQIATGFEGFPTPSDIGYLGVVVPVVIALVLTIRGRLPLAEELAVYLDSAAIFLAIGAAILAMYGNGLAHLGFLAATVTVAYPILHLATAGAGMIALLAVRRAVLPSGGYLVLAGFAVVGLAWVEWLREALVAAPPAGSLINYFFAIGIIIVGIGGATWRLGEASGARSRRRTTALLGAVPLVALFGCAALDVFRDVTDTELGIVDAAALGVIVLAGIRQTLLVHERGRLLDTSGQAREDLERALVQRSEADSRYRVLVESVPAAVYIDVADPDFVGGGRVSYMSPQIERILGYPPEAFMTDADLWPQLIHPADVDRTIAAYNEHWASERPLRADYRMVARDGSIVWVHDEAFSMVEASSTGRRRVSQGLVVDTTEQKRLEEQLLHDALHDPLTGMANRVLFRDHVERALAARRRRRTKVAVLFLDLDNFKLVNDSLGHRAGDRLLVEVAQRLQTTIRVTDVAARQGGDEFTILLDRVRNVEEATASADRIAAELRKPIELDGRSIVVGVSIGIAMAGGPDIGADDLLAHADAAMYEAKGHGRARYAVFDPSMRIRATSRLEMETELRTAIDQDQFELHYQPIIELRSSRITGFEALVRWRHPKRGLISPMEFIPLAEVSGLIVPLGRLITATACGQLRKMRDAGICDRTVTMSVNVSPRQAVEPGFAADVAATLAATGLEPSALVLEITESLMLHESASGGLLRQLHEMGVQLVVDDFGTGFSALEYFKRFAVQGLKIDRSFIDGLGRSREDTAIVTATLAFASALGLSVTAEGVETVDQFERLRALGCPQGQGFLFSRPVPAADLPALLAAASLPLPLPPGLRAA